MASSTELSTTSQTKWCKPCSVVEPIYMAGRLRTASRSPRTLIEVASYRWPAALPVTVSFSAIFCASPDYRGREGWRRTAAQNAPFERLASPCGSSKNGRTRRALCSIPSGFRSLEGGRGEEHLLHATGLLFQRDRT